MNSKYFSQIALFLSIALFSACAILIIQTTGPAVFDQHAVVHYRFGESQYASFFRGIGIDWIAGSYQWLVNPTPESANLHFRLLALGAFALPSLALAWKVLPSGPWLVIFVLFLFGSRYPMLWLSTELFAAGVLVAVFLARLKPIRPWILGALIAFLGTLKVELVVAAGALWLWGLYEARSKKERWNLSLGFVGTTVLIHGIGTAIRGAQYWNEDAGRSLTAMLAHYADVFYKHQTVGTPTDTYTDMSWKSRIFPEAQTLGELLWRYPSHYFDFLAMSLARTLKRLASVYQLLFLLFPLAAAAFFARRKNSPARTTIESQRRPIESWITVSLIGILPVLIVGFVHVRYFARYFVPVLLLLILWTERELQKPEPFRGYRMSLKTIWGVAAVVQAVVFAQSAINAALAPNFWFPD